MEFVAALEEPVTDDPSAELFTDLGTSQQKAYLDEVIGTDVVRRCNNYFHKVIGKRMRLFNA